jgi:sulfate permease, SulP family
VILSQVGPAPEVRAGNGQLGEEVTVSTAAAMTPPVGSLQRYVPILGWLPTYRREWLPLDALAAMSVWALMVPQGLAYAALAGVPVQYGLYSGFAALVAYAVFGTSRHVVCGPSATVAAVSSATIAPLIGASALGTDEAAKYAAALALATGAVYLVLGALRMGWVSNFLSKAVLSGFVLGFAVGIIIDQSYKLLGVPEVEGTYVEKLVGTIREITDTDGTTLVVGALSLGVLLLLRYKRPRWPRALVVTVLSIAAVTALDLSEEGVAVTGHVPTGMFSVGLPGVGWTDTGALLAGALAVIFVGYSESLASARMMALKHDYRIDASQELIAQGAACGASGFAGGFVVDGSLSKTSVADTAGQKTQMASLINAGLILLTMLFLAGLFEDLPSAALGAVVIDSMIGLIELGPMKRYFRVDRADFVFASAALLGLLFLGIIWGVVIGVVLSLLLLVARASRPGLHRLGHEPVSDAYLDVDRFDGLEATPGVLVVRLDGPLFFADANRFKDGVRAMLDVAGPSVRAVVLDADAVSQSDTDGADILIELASYLSSKASRLVLARVSGGVGNLWDRAGVLDVVGRDNVFVTVREAVSAATEPSSRGDAGASSRE